MAKIEDKSIEEKRNFDRSTVNLKTIVQIRNSETDVWKETVEVKTVSMNGAAFELFRECPVGSLLLLLLPMPTELRRYDLDEKLYRVVALVQSCYEFKVDDESYYHVGVAFAGKNVPESYIENPLQHYRIAGVAANGTWKIVESGKPFKVRKHRRIWNEFEVALTLFQEEEGTLAKEVATTKDVSEGGAKVLCSLDAKVGDRVKFACNEYDFYTIAEVRNVVEATDGKRSLHLEFVDSKFPISEIPPLVSDSGPEADLVSNAVSESDSIPDSDSDANPVEYEIER